MIPYILEIAPSACFPDTILMYRRSQQEDVEGYKYSGKTCPSLARENENLK